MASGGGGQQFGGGSYGNPWGNSFGSLPLGGQSFGGQSFSPAGKIGYQPQVNRYQPAMGGSNPMAVDNNWYERGQGMPPVQRPPMAIDNNWYERGQGMPPTQAAPQQTPQFTPSAQPVNRAQPAYSGPMFTPGQTLTADQLPQFNDFLKAGGYSLNRPNAYGQPNYGTAGGPGDRYANPNWMGRADNPMAIAPPPNPVTLDQSNPTNPGYNPGDGWRFMLQRYAQDEGRPWDYYLKG